MSAMKETVREATAGVFAALLHRRSQPLPAIDGVLLVVAPHPDDEVLGCGGLIARQAAAGRRVHVLFLTDGEHSHANHPTLTATALAAQRRDEALAALAALGVRDPRSTATFLGAPDGRLDKLAPDDRAALIEVLRKWIVADQPETICVPFLGGGSSEHDGATAMVTEAAARAGASGRLLQYPIWAWWNAFRLRRRLRHVPGNFHLGLGDARRAKQAAMACYRSQVEPTPPWPEPVLPRAILKACTTATEFYFRDGPTAPAPVSSPRNPGP